MRAPRPSSSGPNTSATCSKTSSDTSTGCTSCRRVSTWRTSLLSHETRRCGGCSPRAAPIPRTPATPTSVYPTEERRAVRALLRHRGAHGSLLREAPPQQGSPRPVRGASRGRRAGRDRRLRRLPRRARAARSERALFTGALEHRHLSGLIPLTDVTVVPSIFPEAFGMVAAEAAAAGRSRSWPTTRGSPRSRPASPRSIPEGYGELASFETGNASELAGSSAGCSPSNRRSATSSRRRPGRRSWTAGAGPA